MATYRPHRLKVMLVVGERRARTPSSLSITPEAGMTKRPERRWRFLPVIGSTRSEAPSASTSTGPARRPRRSRSVFGITNRPALSMVVLIPEQYHMSGRLSGGLLATTQPLLRCFSRSGSAMAAIPGQCLGARGRWSCAVTDHALMVEKLERETGDDAPSTNQVVTFEYRLNARSGV